MIEPRLQLFEIPAIKLVNNFTIIGTCAFTGYLFLHYLPSYIDGILDTVRFGLVAVTVLVAVVSSTQIRFVKVLSLASSGLFFALIGGSFIAADMGASGLWRHGESRRLLLPASSLCFQSTITTPLPLLVVCLEHHDRAVHFAVCERVYSVAASTPFIGGAINSHRAVVRCFIGISPMTSRSRG